MRAAATPIVLLSLTLAGPASAEAHAADEAAWRVAEQRRVAVVAEAARATIALFEASGTSGGSGVLVSREGFAVTNFHVVAPCGPEITVGLSDGTTVSAVLVGLDPTGDIAVVKLRGDGPWPAAPWADSSRARVGDEVLVLGNPFLLAEDFAPSVSFGVLSGVGRYQYPSGSLLEYADCLQTDAAINPGNSGGPLFDARGRVLGVNGRASFEKRGRVSVGVGYAVSANQVRRFLSHLCAGRVVDHGSLGVTVRTTGSTGVVVDAVDTGADAFRRGVRPGDEVVALDGAAVATANDVLRVVGALPEGWRIAVTLRRGGEEQTVPVRLGPLHGPGELRESVEGELASGPGSTPGHAAAAIADYEPAPDFANRHFNRLELARVLAAWRRVEPETLPETLGLRGATQADDARVTLAVDRIEYRDGRARYLVDPRAPLAEQPAPSGAPGLASALWAWRALAAIDSNGSPAPLDDAQYVGRLPWAAGAAAADVIRVEQSGAVFEFSFATGDAALGPVGRLVGVEASLDAMDDPTRIEVEPGGTLRISVGDRPAVRLSMDDKAPREGLAAAAPPPAARPGEGAAGSLATRFAPGPLEGAAACVAKLYGAGGFVGVEAGQTALVISPDGLLATADGPPLETGEATAVLSDGRRFTAEVVATDPVAEVALLGLMGLPEEDRLDCFDLAGGRSPAAADGSAPSERRSPRPGERIWAISNAFGIAAGREAPTVQRGVVAAVAPLAAYRPAGRVPVVEDALVLDAITSNPSAAGGAVTDARGRLLGMIGAELRSRVTGAWHNYAVPVAVVERLAQSASQGATALPPAGDATGGGPDPWAAADRIEELGLVFVPEFTRRTPPWIEYVAEASPAGAAGLRPDDLLVAVDGTAVATVEEAALRIASAGERAIELTVLRSGELVSLRIAPSTTAR